MRRGEEMGEEGGLDAVEDLVALATSRAAEATWTGFGFGLGLRETGRGRDRFGDRARPLGSGLRF